MLTDPDSLYRKLYNKSLAFFLWVIEVDPEPFTFKLHITANTLKEINIAMIRTSVEALIGSCGSHGAKSKINVQFFAKKKQFKVFVTIEERQLAQSFFQTIWHLKELPILDQNDCTSELF